ncbi:unnamed protein product [Symbiodinium natans]|uniref:Uncharacterized protein n=1 Tax=Symbiodinium natans TaxID=878477 RepID=A0A812T5P3_9DINO|nr:unnamed protein product [Symbiodinium natans]
MSPQLKDKNGSARCVWQLACDSGCNHDLRKLPQNATRKAKPARGECVGRPQLPTDLDGYSQGALLMACAKGLRWTLALRLLPWPKPAGLTDR